MEQPTPQFNNTRSTEDKTVAIISYLFLIGWIIGLVLHNGSNKTKLGAFHLRQSLGIMILMFAVGILVMMFMFIPFLGWAVSTLLYLGSFVVWLLALIGAINGDMKPIPVIGEMFQKWFAGFIQD